MIASRSASSAPKCKRRWVQYSLRTLLVFVTIVALACSWIGVWLQRGRERRLAWETLTSRRWALFYQERDDTELEDIPPGEPGPDWLKKLLGDDPFVDADATCVMIPGGVEATDAEFDYLKCFPHLRHLLAWRAARDSHLARLAGMRNLAGTLEFLDLSGGSITDAGLKNLQGFTRLRRLILDETPIGDTGLDYLKGLGRLQQLSLGRTRVTDAGLEHLEGLHELVDLDIGSTGITDRGLEHLKGLSRLDNLSLMGTRVTAGGVQKLQHALPNCLIASAFRGTQEDTEEKKTKKADLGRKGGREKKGGRGEKVGEKRCQGAKASGTTTYSLRPA
jgi:hypothetical protein